MADEQAKREELIRQIASLPTGSLTKKTVKGREYWYLRVKENGKRRELYVPRDEVESLREQLALRKRLEQELVKGGQRGGASPCGGLRRLCARRGRAS